MLGEAVSDTITGVTDRDTLPTAILDDPADDTAGLVMADLLRESDDADAQARGRTAARGQMRFRKTRSVLPLHAAVACGGNG